MLMHDPRRPGRRLQTPHLGFPASLARVSLCQVFGVLLAGCSPGGPEIATVTGTVTMDGKPLPLAAVVFIPENGRPAGATTDDGGRYSLSFSEGRDGAIPGKNRVLITTKRDPWRDAKGEARPSAKEKVPMKYNAKSELEFVVESGKSNLANFDLDSKGPISRDVDDLDAQLKPFAVQ